MKDTIATNNSADGSDNAVDAPGLFPNYGDATRVWIHPLCREVTRKEDIFWAESQLKKMVQEWTAHEEPVPGDYAFHRHRFVIIANPHRVSGCGIDYSFREVDKINRFLGGSVEGSSGNYVYYLDGGRVHSLPRYKIHSAIESATIRMRTLIINISLTSLGEIRKGLLELPAAESLLSNYFKD